MLKPASLPVIRESGGAWNVTQNYYRLGRVVTVSGWGVSRADAFKALERAKEWHDQPDYQPFKALFEVLWTCAGGVDSLIRLLTCIKALLMGKK